MAIVIYRQQQNTEYRMFFSKAILPSTKEYRVHKISAVNNMVYRKVADRDNGNCRQWRRRNRHRCWSLNNCLQMCQVRISKTLSYQHLFPHHLRFFIGLGK